MCDEEIITISAEKYDIGNGKEFILNFDEDDKYNIRMYEKDGIIYMPIKFIDKYYYVRVENGCPIVDITIKKENEKSQIVNFFVNATLGGDIDIGENRIYTSLDKEKNLKAGFQYI